MSDKFDRILNDCIDRINGGQSIESCLERYKEHADELKPMLMVMFDVKGAFDSVPTAAAKQRAKQRLMAALYQPEKKKIKAGFTFPVIFRNMKVLAAAAAVLVMVLAGYFGVVYTSTQIIPAEPGVDGNFSLLISDEPNAIGDFESLVMKVDKVQLKSAEGARKWIEIEVSGIEVDLVLLQDGKAFEIWRGDVPDGDYSEVVLFSNSVVGTLAGSGGRVDIKLPSGRLSLGIEFTVGGDEATEFVYDIVVLHPGQSGLYLLQPNAAKSGTDREIIRVDHLGQILVQVPGQGPPDGSPGDGGNQGPPDELPDGGGQGGPPDDLPGDGGQVP